MNYIKVIIGLTLASTMLVACDNKKDIEQEQEISAPIVQGKEVYQTKLPVKFNISREALVKNMDNPLDISELEMELMELSMDHFSPKKHSFQEGQYLNEKIMYKWLERKSKEETKGLNPSIVDTGNPLKDEKKSPKILSHILEQNYLNKDGKIEGISLALSLKTFYYIKVTDSKGLVYTDKVKIDEDKDNINDVKESGKKIAEKVVKRIRDSNDIPDVPILLTLYQEEQRNSVIPGNFLTETYIPEGENNIKEWNDINRKYYAFPSDDLETLDKSTSDSLTYFKEDIQKYFNNLKIVINGKALYLNKDLNDVKIDIEAAGISPSESIALLQFTETQILSRLFLDHVAITVRLMDQNKEKGIMIWDPSDKKVTTHIYK
ncbi:protein involved in sex pheromone biosynthesis [Peribacillus simplex]